MYYLIEFFTYLHLQGYLKMIDMGTAKFLNKAVK